MMPTKARQDLERELRDLEFRRMYGAAEAKSELAIALADARHALGFTQEEMSKTVGVSQPYVAKLESGDANPTIGAIGSMLGVLNLRLHMETVPLLAKPVSVGSAATFFLGAISGYEPAGDTCEVVIMATPTAAFPRETRRQQSILFQTEDYNPFKPWPEGNEVWAGSAKGYSTEEVLGGQKV